jgi:cysteine desulfurase
MFGMPQNPVYLDNNATTQVDPAVLDAMMPFLTEWYGNPSSVYQFGKKAADAVENAREQVAALIRCQPSEIIFTSCGTESNNASLVSALSMDVDRQHIITTRVEHSSILKHCEALAKRGYEITWLGVDSEGLIDLDELREAVRADTAIVSVMTANNETGVIGPIAEVAAIAREKRVLFHTDAVQAVGKIPIDLRDSKINFLSLSGHKLHCPKGVGALFVDRRTRFQPYLIGGGQEGGRRAGTENVASIVGLGKACELAAHHQKEENTKVRGLRDRFESGILERIADVRVNGDIARRLPNTSSLSFAGIDAEGILMLLDKKGICCSSGSACTTGSLAPSHVLKAMGLSDDRARGTLRFSFSRFNSEDDVHRALEAVTAAVEKMRIMLAA